METTRHEQAQHTCSNGVHVLDASSRASTMNGMPEAGGDVAEQPSSGLAITSMPVTDDPGAYNAYTPADRFVVRD